MGTFAFDYYMHDDYNTDERLDWISKQVGFDIDPESELAEKIGRPFYEVKLECELDFDTGIVTILKASN